MTLIRLIYQSNKPKVEGVSKMCEINVENRKNIFLKPPKHNTVWLKIKGTNGIRRRMKQLSYVFVIKHRVMCRWHNVEKP